MLASLSFPGGLPYGLIAITVPAWLADQGVSATEIGLVGLAQMPWSLKFLWAPLLLDRLRPPLLDRRRGFILIAQILLVLTMPLLALVPPHQVWLVFAVVLAIVFASATQDIAMDAYAVELLDKAQYGPASGLRTTFYRLAMLVSGGAAIALGDQLAWPVIFALLAALMLPSTLLTRLAPALPEPEQPAEALDLWSSLKAPIVALWRQPASIPLLAFVFLYKFGDAVAVGMLSPFFRAGLGVSLTEIGFLQKTVGLVATVFGAMTGGALLPRIGLYRGLFAFGLLQALTSVLYALTAYHDGLRPLMYGAITCEQAASGMATSALIALMMSVSEKRWAATQFAVLSSVMGIGRTLAVAIGGALADAVGYGPLFLIAAALGIPGLILIRSLASPPTTPALSP
ncbi:MAG: MFS transporter [Myxococcota bacterium]